MTNEEIDRRDIIAGQREAHRDLQAENKRLRAALTEVFSFHCECRPIDVTRDSHSHDCYCDTLDVVQAALAGSVDQITQAGVDDRRRWSLERLRTAEHDFLVEHAWTFVGDDCWLPPPGMFDGDRATTARRTGHAVNTQKFFSYSRRR